MSASRITVRVIPRAKRDELAGWRGEALLVRLQAPPVEGAANQALVKLLARLLETRPADVRILKGDRSRDKVVEIQGLAQVEVEQRLRQAVGDTPQEHRDGGLRK